MYKRAAEFWAELRVELLSASAFLTDDKPNSSQVWRVYWASHQVYYCGLGGKCFLFTSFFFLQNSCGVSYLFCLFIYHSPFTVYMIVAFL